MGDVKQMMFPLMIVLLSFNAMFLFITYLPAAENQGFDGNAWRAMDYNGVDASWIRGTLANVVSDTNGAVTTSVDGNTGVATTTERTLPSPLTNIIYGALGGVAGCVIGFTAGGVLGCAAGAVGLGLLGFFWQYFSVLAFGFFMWIDYFINPSWGVGFMWFGLGIKVIFSIIMILGLLAFLLPLFSSWRK